MLEIWGNRITSSNPFGSSSEEDILEFESNNGIRLPHSYKTYLLAANGGKFERQFFAYFENGSGVNQQRLNSLFALGGGPFPLEEYWLISNFYDMDAFEFLARRFVVIGDLAGGNLLLIKVSTGEIFLYEHDHFDFEEDETFIDYLHFVSKDFGDFVGSLVEYLD